MTTLNVLELIKGQKRTLVGDVLINALAETELRERIPEFREQPLITVTLTIEGVAVPFVEFLDRMEKHMHYCVAHEAELLVTERALGYLDSVEQLAMRVREAGAALFPELMRDE